MKLAASTFGFERYGATVRQRAASVPWISVVLVIGASLRLWKLGAWGLGMDEAYSANAAARSLVDLVRFVAADDFHPPLYYILLHSWRALGTDEVILRIPSVIFGTLAIWIVYRLGLLLLDRPSATLGALILAISPLHIWHSQEVRMYSLLFLLSTVSMYAFVRFLRGGARKVRALYLVATVLALYTDYGGFVLLAGQNLTVIILLVMRRQIPLRGWILIQAVSLLAFAPWMSTLLTTVPETSRWMAQRNITPALTPQFGFTLASFTSHFLPMGTPVLKAGVAGIFSVIALAGAYFWRSSRLAVVMLLATSFGALGLAAVGSQVTRVFFVRTLIAASATFYLLVAAGILGMRRRALSLLLLGTLLVLNVYSLSRMYYHVTKAGPWREVAGYVSVRHEPEDGIVFVGGAWHRPFDFYAAPQGLRLPSVKYDHPRDLRRVDELLQHRSRVWLVLKESHAYDPRGRAASLLRSRGILVDQRSFRDGITVELYSVRPLSR